MHDMMVAFYAAIALVLLGGWLAAGLAVRVFTGDLLASACAKMRDQARGLSR
jgi:hypothetical protein